MMQEKVSKSGGAEGGRVLASVSASHLLNHLSMTVMSFLIPTVVARELGLDTVQVGLLSATAQLTSGVFQMAFAVLSNFVRKNLIMSLGNALQAVSSAMAFAVRGFVDVLALRFLWGVGSAPQHPVASSMISESYRDGKRGFALSVHMGIAYVGNMVGPLLATYLATNLGWRMAFALVGIPQLLLASFFAISARRQTPIFRADPNGAPRSSGVKESLARSLVDSRYALINLSQVLVTAARGLNLWITYLPIYLVSVKGFDVGTSAMVVSAFLAAGSLGTIVFGWLGERTNKMALAAMSTLLTSALLVYLGVFGLSGTLLIAMIVVMGFVSLEVVVALQSYLSSISDDVTRNSAFGVFFTTGFVAASFWTAFVGYLIQNYGFSVAFLVMGCVSLPAAFIMLRLGYERT
ncbi:MAG: MFS transporter [Nitrososphaerota archaeon]